MQMCSDSPCIFGKIKVWDEPIFDLDLIESNLGQFKADIIEKLKLQVAKLYIKPPNPNTILGKNVETIRFTTAYLIDNNDLIDKLDFGIGENGYYYDAKIKTNDLTIDKFCLQIGKLIEICNDLETKIQYLQNQIIEIKNLKTSEDKKNKKSKGE